MKHLACYLLFFLAFSQISFAQKNKDKKTFEYADGVSFTVFATQHTRAYGGSQTTTYVAEKGYEFLVLILEFKNDSKADAELDFSKFSVLDKTGGKYPIMGVVQAYKISNTDQDFSFTLKQGKGKKYILTFKPYPKGEPVAQLVSGEEIFTITEL